MTGHIVRAYDAELAELDSLISEMGGLAEAQLRDASLALLRRDPGLAAKAIDSDWRIDELERLVHDKAVALIAKRQPVAVDLRHIMTVLKIAGDIERIGDLSKNVAKCAQTVIGEGYLPKVIAGLGHMSEMAARQLKEVLDAFGAADREKALRVWRGDVRLDALYNSVFRELLTYMMEDTRSIGVCTQLLFGAKNLERIGDHATNIAENIHFLVSGSILADERPKSDDTSSLGDDEEFA